MEKNLYKLLCDPETGEDLELIIEKKIGDEILKGKLVSSSNEYEIINSIPRFINKENYSNNFGWQWNKWASVQFEHSNINKPMEGYTTRMFNQITEWEKDNLSEKIVLDMGCGSGRFTDVVLSNGGYVIAVDNSSAIDAAKDNLKENLDKALFVQADVLNLPIKDNVVDLSFSIGVLHHTPDPLKGINESFRTLKKNGEFALSVYSKNTNYDLTMVHLWRKVFRATWPIFRQYPPLIYSYLFGGLNHYLAKLNRFLTYPIKIIFPTISLPDLRWSILDTFDSITTSYQSSHTFYEVYSWLKDSGYSESRPGIWYLNYISKK